MADLKQIEADAVAALHDILGKAQTAEPALEAAGVPAVLVDGLKGVVNATLNHFQTEHPSVSAAGHEGAPVEPPAAEAAPAPPQWGNG